MDKETLKMFSEMLDSKLEAIEDRLNGIDNRLDKSTMLLEDLSGKVETMAEVQKLHMEQNENTHIDIVKSFSEKIEVIELAVKNTSMDVKEIKMV